MTYHVAIIGGGLAGLALAIDLRKRSYPVIIIEKGKYPRQKVCGEYISMESKAYLLSLCPELSKLELPQIHRFRLTSTGNQEFNTKLTLGGFGISRYLLEDLLYKEACKLGVDFMLETKATDIQIDDHQNTYTIETNRGKVNTYLVCNATGRKSNFEKQSKDTPARGTNYIGVKYHLRLQRDADLIEIHNFRGGYCGISNIEEGKSCLCYIVNAKKLNAVNNSIRELEQTTLFRNNHLKEIFTNAHFITPEPVTISGINFRIKRTVSDGIIFLGDAAGSISPITGNGMSMALRSASALATAIDNCFAAKISVIQLKKSYDIFWKQQFSSRVKASRQLQKLSERPILANLSINVFNAFPSLARNVIRQTHGQPF